MDKEERLISSTYSTREDAVEESLRPPTLAEYVGQADMKEKLHIYIEAAKQRGEALDHVLLYGPPGLGKTTLAHIIANEMGANIHTTSGPAIERPADLAAILTNMGAGDVLFIDEIHRLNRTVEEILYPAMEDYSLDIVLGQGPMARTTRIPLKRFTLVGATTRAGSLSSPLRDRFGVLGRLELYSQDELMKIVHRSARIMRIETDGQGAEEIARRSRGTPRVANRLLRRVRDYAQVRGSGIIDLASACDGLSMMGIDGLGLDKSDKRILTTMIEKYGGGPVGVDALSAASGEETVTIEDVIEPYLMQLGFINRTPRGRVAMKAAYEYLGLTALLPGGESAQLKFEG